jgi:hypothetical protein
MFVHEKLSILYRYRKGLQIGGNICQLKNGKVDMLFQLRSEENAGLKIASESKVKTKSIAPNQLYFNLSQTPKKPFRHTLFTFL